MHIDVPARLLPSRQDLIGLQWLACSHEQIHIVVRVYPSHYSIICFGGDLRCTRCARHARTSGQISSSARRLVRTQSGALPRSQDAPAESSSFLVQEGFPYASESPTRSTRTSEGGSPSVITDSTYQQTGPTPQRSPANTKNGVQITT
jgi:hypothetical protein